MIEKSSFQDEIKRSLRTPQEVMEEEENLEIQRAKRCAQLDFSSLKKELTSMASNGRYLTYKGYIEVCADVKSCATDFFKRDVKTTHYKLGAFCYRCYSVCTCECKNMKMLKAYLDEIKRLTEPEGIEVKLVGECRDELYKATYAFDVPGEMRINGISNSRIDLRIGLNATMRIKTDN